MIDRRRLLAGAITAPTILIRPARAQEPVFVLAWGGYTDQPLLDRFAALTGITVVVDNVSSYDEIFLHLRTKTGNQYSVIAPHHGLVKALQQQQLLQPIDPNQISHLSKIEPSLAVTDAVVFDSQTWAVPLLFGTTPCIYNTELLPEPPTTWSDLDSDAFTGRLGMLDDPLGHFYLAGLAVGSTTVPALEPADFAQASDLLTDLKRNRVSHFTAYPDDLVTQLSGGKAVISTTGYEGMTLYKEAAGKLAVARLAPHDFSFVQALAIPANAPNPIAAHAFIDFMLEKNEQAGLANRTQRGIVNLGAVPLMDPAVASLTNYADLHAVLTQSPILGFPPLATSASPAATYADWIVAWDAVRQTTSRARPD